MAQESAFAFVGPARGAADGPDTMPDRDLVETVLHRHGAEGVDWRRNGALAAFATGTSALRCALDMVEVPPVATAPGGLRVGIDVPVDPDAPTAPDDLPPDPKEGPVEE